MKQISGTNGEGNNLPSGDFSRERAEAERMMRELRNRNFGKQLTEAEAEKTEARLCKDIPNSLHAVHSHGLEIERVKYNVRSPVTGGEARHFTIHDFFFF